MYLEDSDFDIDNYQHPDNNSNFDSHWKNCHQKHSFTFSKFRKCIKFLPLTQSWSHLSYEKINF